ncbi:choline kinase alpha-like [Bradysia coprophila]|uniref:choline kinase alpha-like n=1 Tax=Bradysia coprophila TaxID=38358 RepID=UPI00187DA0FF|nr:choline kinase alpha-like [Bradysia coprophila]
MDIDKARALELAVSFVSDQWNSLSEDDITVRIFSGGYSGRLYIVEDVSETSNTNPIQKFLVRLYGGKLIENDDIVKAGKCETSEGIVFFANGIQGLGPKLFGVFDGGRVEEFIPSHRLTEADLTDDNISLELVRKLARFHALQLPVPKQKRDILLMSVMYQDEYNKDNTLKLAKRVGIDPDELRYLDDDYVAEHAFLRSFESKVSGRLVLCHGDLNKNNILVRDTPDRFDERVMLIDYELAATDYRGCDLGALLVCKVLEMTDDGAFNIVCEWPDEKYRRMILTEYLNETKKLNYFKFDANGLDSVDHLMMEVDFFVMYTLQLFKGFFKKMPNSEFFHQQPDVMISSWLKFIPVMAKMYDTHKANFIERYSKVI